MIEQPDRIMDGDLQTLGLQSILKMLALSGKTGRLFVYSEPEKLSVSLRKGQIVATREDGASPSSQPDLLEMLCLLNRLNPQQVQDVHAGARGDTSLALSMLVERGWLEANEMQRRLEFAVTQSISHALRWVNGRFAFYRHLSIESHMQPLDVDSVFLEALRQTDEWEEITREGVHLTGTTVARWLPEVSKDVRSLGLSREAIEALCLANGEIPLQSIALVLMLPEARVAKIMAHLLDLKLIEVVDTTLETEVQHDISDIITRCQHILVHQRHVSSAEQHLLGLMTTLSECINGLLTHHGKYARSLHGRGQLGSVEIARYLERRFARSLHMLATQRYPLLETATLSEGQLDCTDILTLSKIVRGVQLEEFYWEAVQGFAAFAHMIFDVLLRDEIGTNSHTGRQLSFAWKMFFSEITHEVQHYQVYRAHRNAQAVRGRNSSPSPPIGIVPTWNGDQQGNKSASWSSETRRSSM